MKILKEESNRDNALAKGFSWIFFSFVQDDYSFLAYGMLGTEPGTLELQAWVSLQNHYHFPHPAIGNFDSYCILGVCVLELQNGYCVL